MKFQDAPLVEKFNPEGDSYDYQIAIDSGGSADESGHWSSIDPRTGMVLKGRNHPTWDLTVEEETKLGNTIIKADDGRYYSIKLPRYMSEAKPILPETGLEDTPDNWQERAKRDYNFAVENNETISFVDTIKKEWATSSGLRRKIPFAGGLYGFFENVDLIDIAKRLQANDYEWRYGAASAEAQFELPEDKFIELYGNKEKWIEGTKQADKKVISDYYKYISSEKTVMAKITEGVSVMPTWCLEFAATGGLASLGDEAAMKAGEKILGEYAKSTAGKLALKAVGWSGAAIARSGGLGSQVLDKMSQRQVDIILGLRQEEGWAMSALVAWGDTVIEAGSEASGEAITKGGGFLLGKLPFGSKLVSSLETAWIKATGGTKGEFVRKLFSKGGYSNILGELGEERLGTILRAITDVDDFGLGNDASMIDRLKAGILQDIENIGVELGVLLIPMAGEFTLGQIANLGRVKSDFDSTKFDQAKEQPKPVTWETVPEIALPESVKQVKNATTDETGLKIVEFESPEKAKEATQEIADFAQGNNINVEIIQQENTVRVKELTEAAATPPVEAKTPEQGTVTTPEAVKPQQVTPVTIETANTYKEINDITEQIITQGVDPAKTSARQADLQEDRVSLGLDGVASPERKSWQQSLQQAKNRNIITTALRIAAEVNSNPRPLNDVETAGLVMKAAQLKREHKDLMQKVAETDDPTEIWSFNSQLDAIEGEFQTVTQALYRSGTEKGRALASQKLTINQDFDLLSLKTRAKKIKGKPLTEAENKKIEQLAKDLELQQKENELLQRRINEIMAKDFVRRGSVSRYSRMDRANINAELDSLINRTKQLLDEGCYN